MDQEGRLLKSGKFPSQTKAQQPRRDRATEPPDYKTHRDLRIATNKLKMLNF